MRSTSSSSRSEEPTSDRIHIHFIKFFSTRAGRVGKEAEGKGRVERRFEDIKELCKGDGKCGEFEGSARRTKVMGLQELKRKGIFPTEAQSWQQNNFDKCMHHSKSRSSKSISANSPATQELSTSLGLS